MTAVSLPSANYQQYHDQFDAARHFLFAGKPAPFISRIHYIREFSFQVDYQEIPGLREIPTRQQLIPRLYAILNPLLTESGIHYHQVLRASLDEKSPPTLELEFEHDIFFFHLTVGPSYFSIRRSASTMLNFVTWYLKFMPMADRIFEALRTELQNVAVANITPTQTSFRFDFLFTNFRRPNDDMAMRNVEVLSSLVRGFPDHNGNFVPITEQEFTRLNLHLSRQQMVGGKFRATWYRLEAPFNDIGRILYCSFSLVSSATERLTRNRVTDVIGFDEQSIHDYGLALNDFLKVQVVQNFLRTLFESWTFQAIPSPEVPQNLAD